MCRLACLLAFAGVTGCSAFAIDGSDCGRFRSVSAFDTLATVAFDLRLTDEEPHEGAAYGFNRADFIEWSVTVPEKQVTAVHLHLDDGRLLWDLTTPDYDPAPGYTASQSSEYSHDADIGNLLGLVRDKRTYIDVHTSGNTQPSIRADITQVNFQDWATSTCGT
jgi:hypothetical protein